MANESRPREPGVKLDLFRVAGRRNEVAVLAYEPRRSRNVWVVAGHGYSSSKQNLDLLCYFLASHGYGIFSLDFPGHKLGASGGWLESVDDLVDAMGAVVNHVRDEHDGPIYMMGHSMGGYVALAALRLAPHRITALGLRIGAARVGT